MKTINTTTVLTDFKGNPINVSGNDLTIGDVISKVLGGKVSDPTMGWILGKKFATENTVDLKAEDVVFIKKELENNAKVQSTGYFSLVIGQIINEFLDN